MSGFERIRDHTKKLVKATSDGFCAFNSHVGLIVVTLLLYPYLFIYCSHRIETTRLLITVLLAAINRNVKLLPFLLSK